MMKIIKFWFKKKGPSLNDTRLKNALEESKKRRELAEKKIDGMLATLDGCGDRWFLKPLVTIDECQPDKDIDGAKQI